VPERTNWKNKKLDEIDARNIRTALRQTYSFPQKKLQLSLAKLDKDKYDTRDKKQHNLQQFIKQPGSP